MLPAWREATMYTETERAAPTLTEAVTLIAGTHVPEDVEADTRRCFDRERDAAFVYAIAAINTWNRLDDHLSRRTRKVSASPHDGHFDLIGTRREDPR